MPNPQCAVALDVGGTTVDGAVVDKGGAITWSQRIASPSEETSEVIIAALADLISDLRGRGEQDEREVVGCGVAMPGPFDYATGISEMRHKFAAIYGVDLKRSLTERTGLALTFINDGGAFGLGAAVLTGGHQERLMALTLGTGLGVAYVVDGELADDGGGIWNIPYKSGILEDAVSRRSLENSYREQTRKAVDVATIADRARDGDGAATEAFRQFGEALGDALYLGGRDFAPDRFVLGGGIARAAQLFIEPALQRYEEQSDRKVPLDVVLEGAALVGAARSAFSAATQGRIATA